ncbi:hypothetical protein FW778_21320 [Ginsengibacter hankyongi]|uniref:Uncharacterized protein n=1 Tax=Ginsengibacter hankyongi TaxID=2607284 RepID=A0A5J5IBX9_9BACT|nr:hypothetical protein [Ginsengibacter hankyongi]KAA9035502.1 hypothetical protein FW778_21320 [Ginsengibacter hankyongi]
MTEEEKKRLDKLRWEAERKQKQSQLNEKLKLLLTKDKYEFLSFEESDKIQLASDGWPDNKWKDSLYFQAALQNKTAINEIVKKYTDTTKSDSVFLFFMNFNFGLVKISNSILINYWSELIEVDGDEIFCLQQDDPSFICIEKTEDIIVGNESEGRQWLYEVTFSNADIKSKLT